MTALSIAVERKQWELVALQLLLSISRAADNLPPETFDALLDHLSSQHQSKGAKSGN